jgi:hypothetical protein
MVVTTGNAQRDGQAKREYTRLGTAWKQRSARQVSLPWGGPGLKEQSDEKQGFICRNVGPKPCGIPFQ